MLPPSRHSNVIACLSACLQDDIVHEDLTVRENLEYSAWLRNPKYMRTRAKGDLVDDVINVLNLRSVQHSVVGTAEKRGIRCVYPSVDANTCKHMQNNVNDKQRRCLLGPSFP